MTRQAKSPRPLRCQRCAYVPVEGMPSCPRCGGDPACRSPIPDTPLPKRRTGRRGLRSVIMSATGAYPRGLAALGVSDPEWSERGWVWTDIYHDLGG